MRTTSLLPLLLPFLPLLTTAQDTTLPAKAQSALLDYYSSIVTEPAYSSAVQAVVTALPESDIDSVIASPTEYFLSLATATAPPAWFTALPTTYQQYFSSVEAKQLGIVSSATASEGAGARQTAAPMVKKVVGAAGVIVGAGVALL
ncbi:uncharacterized protein KY384_007178 [Bacidia gigantensis]|uniref:uncharacterized protein n=1 Tax=Bacidia gigantensis TaxID=2732470 RepID=UPI001D043E62|nr:uncharacterized protein KY384_007178 [Bacidia gigantensis]KAG8528261.1 hypothetical protein KY384_007178 [Bacidia gigantensis]